jgi:hypothetical protein
VSDIPIMDIPELPATPAPLPEGLSIVEMMAHMQRIPVPGAVPSRVAPDPLPIQAEGWILTGLASELNVSVEDLKAALQAILAIPRVAPVLEDPKPVRAKKARSNG